MSLTAAERVERLINEVRGVKAQFGINEWAWGFLLTLQKEGLELRLTEARRKVLEELEGKVFKGAA